MYYELCFTPEVNKEIRTFVKSIDKDITMREQRNGSAFNIDISCFGNLPDKLRGQRDIDNFIGVVRKRECEKWLLKREGE